ncbi:Enhancer of polycomb-like transcription factor protein [Forsythia ovata]|uniref:Enhancer of polycomb-like transcription factor protein n=1 Tax=Forsythia ovata TaxID=205694 RepID=A0ABD1WFN6_9LAMI
MEKSVAKSGSVKIPKKKRSLDLQSLYNSENSEEGQNETKTLKDCDPEDGKKKGRKNRKSLSLSSFKSEAKKSRKDCGNRVTMASGSSGRLTSGCESEAKNSTEDCGNSVTVRLGSSGKLTSGSKEFNDSYLTSLENENVLRIPKHPRSPVGPKKFKSDRVSKLSGLFNSVDRVVKINEKVKKAKDDGSPDDRLVNLVKNSADKVDSLKEKRETVVDEVKRRRNGGASSARHANQEDDLVIVNNVDTSSKKQRSNNRKRKDFAACGGGSGSKTKRAEPSAGRSVSGSVFIDLQDANDYDEENLEQNAARMLSSRFDPSCTGFPSNKESIVSRSTNGLSSVDYSARDLFSRESNSSTRLKSSSADPESVVLRPKKDHKGKNISRKRRHFYEILPKRLDAYWVLKRKIKVFWPLDKKWYPGVVDNYDPVRKLHCVKYDDGVEEWIDLQKEKFKLLLLRSEVSVKEKPEISSTGDKSVHKRKTDLLIDDDGCVDNIGDSEPIISWLARSGRTKALLNPLKKQKTMQMLLPMVSPISSDNTDNANKDAGFLERDRSKLKYDSGMPDSSVVGGRLDDSLVSAPISSQNRVYIRRRSDEEGERFFLWSIHDEGKLRLSVSAVGSKRFRYEICLSAVPFLEYSIGTWDLWLSHSVLIRQHGVIVTTSPAVILEMLFVDNIIGLRFFLFEGCLKQAIDFVSLILTVFNQPTEQWNDDVELPVTSISFRVSSVRDLRKRHVFEFYSFSKLKNSEWLYLDSKLLRHCLLIKQLPISECTYSNIKALECGSFQLSKPCVGLELFSVEGLKKKYVSGVPSMGVSRESCNLRMGQSIFRQAAKHGRLHPFALSFGAAPTFFLSLHLKMLIERNFACINLRDYDTLCSLGNPEDATQQIVEDRMQVESRSVNIENIHAERNFESVVTEAPSYELLSSYTVSDSKVAYKLQDLQNDKPTSSEATVCSKDLVKNKTVVNSLSPNFESNEQVLEQCFVLPLPCMSNSITCTSSNPSC